MVTPGPFFVDIWIWICPASHELPCEPWAGGGGGGVGGEEDISLYILDNVVVKNDKRVSHTRGLFRWHIVQENLNSWKRRYFADLRFQALNDNLKKFIYNSEETRKRKPKFHEDKLFFKERKEKKRKKEEKHTWKCPHLIKQFYLQV